ncbi:MAG: acyl-CoA dehydrogenase family protein, partial [Streptosporangiaceae bacterium]
MSDLLYSEIESDLRSGVRELMAARCRWPDVLAWSEGGGDLASGLWSALAAQDLAGLPVPEELGGSGVGWRETAVVLEELGRAVAPVPFFGSAVLATAALLAAGDKELLPELADGSRLASLAVPLSTLAFVPAVRAEGGRLTGAITSVADALTADVLLVPIDGGLYVVEAEDTRRTAVTTLDLTRPL